MRSKSTAQRLKQTEKFNGIGWRGWFNEVRNSLFAFTQLSQAEVFGFAQTFITENCVGFDREKRNIFHIETSTRRVKLKIQKSKLIFHSNLHLVNPTSRSLLPPPPPTPTHNRICQWRMGRSTGKGMKYWFLIRSKLRYWVLSCLKAERVDLWQCKNLFLLSV